MKFTFEINFAKNIDEEKLDLLWAIASSKWHFFTNDIVFLNILEKIENNDFIEITNYKKKKLIELMKDKKDPKFMTEVKIGIHYSIEEAFRIINAEPKVLLENAINDWNFIQKIIDCLFKCKKDFEFKKQVMIDWVKDAVNEEYIEPLSGGGCDQIHQLAYWYSKRNKYNNIIHFKFAALYDSDKENMDAVSPNFRKARILAGIIKDNSNCFTRIHILTKREIENYIPKNKVLKLLGNNPIKKQNYLQNQDFADLEIVKRSAPKLFKQSTAEELIAQAGNNGAEFIEIIEKIAKII